MKETGDRKSGVFTEWVRARKTKGKGNIIQKE
jgi:hypothetical protein